MWTAAEISPGPRVSPGLRTMYRGVSVAMCLLLICLPHADTTCSNPDADACYVAALNKAQTVKCQSIEIIPDLQTCVNSAIGTCTPDVITFWDTRIQNLESSLKNIVATNTLTCSLACPNKAVETQKINSCSNGFMALLDQIKTKGSNGENVSASCKKAQTAVTCINNAGSCATTVATRTTLIASYDAVKKYCVASTPNAATATSSPLSDKPNQTALIIIGTLILFIIIVNVIICIVYVYHRRHREMKKVNIPMRPMASRISYYQ